MIDRLNADKEAVKPKGREYLEFPSQDGVAFSYFPPDAPIFLGKAARDRQAAEGQLAAGGAKPEGASGTLPVGAFSEVTADGDPACTYDMDIYVDDRREVQRLAAAGPVDGWRNWAHDLEITWGHHNIELYRYRTCADGTRTRIGVAGMEVLLE